MRKWWRGLSALDSLSKLSPNVAKLVPIVAHAEEEDDDDDDDDDADDDEAEEQEQEE
jgi:hypothetical protein